MKNQIVTIIGIITALFLVGCGPEGGDGFNCRLSTNEAALDGDYLVCLDDTNPIYLGNLDMWEETDVKELHRVKELMDPCGRGGIQQEVILTLENGDQVAYFEGEFSFSETLAPGTYTTDDSQECEFEID